MSQLSEKLTELLSKRDIRIAQLAKICQIDRPTLYHYISGKRPLKNLSLLQTIVSPLCLTQSEKLELMEAFDIEREGAVLHQQRKAVETFFHSLPVMQQSERKEQIYMPMNPSDRETGSERVIYGELNVRGAIISILQEAERTGASAKIMLVPEHDKILADLLLVGHFSELKLSHMICMESGHASSKTQNLDALGNAIRCSVILPGYRAYCYYGNVEERFGSLQSLPNVIVTSNVAMQFSVNGKEALLHTGDDVVFLFQSLATRLEDICSPVMDYKQNLLEDINWILNFMEGKLFRNSYEICSGICSIQFWYRELIARYINPKLPGCEQLIEVLASYAESLRNKKAEGYTTLLMNPSCVEEFIRTGVFREYPDYFFSKPLSRGDRRYLLEKMLSACREGWFEIHFIDSGKFPLGFRWEIMVPNETSAFLQYFHNNTFSIFELSECGSMLAIRDYLESLSSSRYAMTSEESEGQIRDWIQSYLT